MALELENGEDIGPALQRVIKELAKKSIALMRQPRSEEAVHTTRKNIKKSRAMLRLMRSVLDDEFTRDNRLLRNAGRQLAPVRDAEVLVETITALRKLCTTETTRRAFRRSRARLMPKTNTVHDSLRNLPARKAAAELNKFLKDARKWPFDSIGQDDLIENLAQVYKKGRRARQLAASHPSIENLHEWRKRVKDLWYAVRLLKPTWPAAMAALGAELERLSDHLGDDHDLAMLRERLDSANSSGALTEDFSVLRDVLDARRSDLQKSAMPLGRRLYVETPRAFARRIGEYWQTARHD
jgi:CHAD domain-containing protein